MPTIYVLLIPEIKSQSNAHWMKQIVCLTANWDNNGPWKEEKKFFFLLRMR